MPGLRCFQCGVRAKASASLRAVRIKSKMLITPLALLFLRVAFLLFCELLREGVSFLHRESGVVHGTETGFRAVRLNFKLFMTPFAGCCRVVRNRLLQLCANLDEALGIALAACELEPLQSRGPWRRDVDERQSGGGDHDRFVPDLKRNAALVDWLWSIGNDVNVIPHRRRRVLHHSRPRQFSDFGWSLSFSLLEHGNNASVRASLGVSMRERPCLTGGYDVARNCLCLSHYLK